jgi:hypothetical protein
LLLVYSLPGDYFFTITTATKTMGKVIDSTPDGYGIYNPITRMWYDPSRKVFIRQYPAQLLLYVVAEQILKSFYRSYQGTRLVINPLNNCRIPATKKVALQRPAR